MSLDEDWMLASVLSPQTPPELLQQYRRSLGERLIEYLDEFKFLTRESQEVLLQPVYGRDARELDFERIQDYLGDGTYLIAQDLRNFLWLSMPAESVTTLRTSEETRNELRRLGVDRIWPNLPLYPQADPVDKLVGTTFEEALSVIGFSKKTPAAGQGVRWAVIDTDVRNTHEFFSNAKISRFVVTDTDIVSDPNDFSSISGHGTHVTGIIHAVAPGAEIISIGLTCVDDGDGGVSIVSTGHLERALEWVVKQTEVGPIHGVNISLAIEPTMQDRIAGEGPGCAALNECVAAGKVVVVAAGNHAAQRGWFQEVSITDPANAIDALVVGAANSVNPKRNGVWTFSSHGPTPDGRSKPDLVAPGVGIRSCGFGGDDAYHVESGTSQAAAFVSGAAAVLMSRSGRTLTPQEVSSVLRGTAQDLGRLETYQGAGLLQLDKALNQLV